MKDQTVHQLKQENKRNSDGKYLGPHLLDIFKNHVAMSIKGSHTAEKFPVITTIDEDLSMILDTHHKDREWSCIELLFFVLRTLPQLKIE